MPFVDPTDPEADRLPRGAGWAKTAVPYGCLFLFAFLFWVPFGFHTTGLVEEWSVMAIADLWGPPFYITARSPLAHHQMRPLETSLHALAYELTPDSFVAFNVIQMLLFFLKGAVAFAVLRHLLRGAILLPLMASMLYSVYPSGTGLFTLRTVSIHGAVSLYLLAVYCLLRYWSGRQAGYLLGVFVFLVSSLLMYEIAGPAAILTPLVLLAAPRDHRARWVVALVAWWAALAVVAARSWMLFRTHRFFYEADLVDLRPTSGNLAGMGQSLVHFLSREVLSWRECGSLRVPVPRAVPTYLGLGLVLALAIAVGIAREAEFRPPGLWLVAGGCLLAVLGVATYLIMPSHRFIDLQTHFLSSLGASVAICGLVSLVRVGPRSKIVFAAATGILLIFATPHALAQHAFYARLSMTEQQALASVVAAAPEITDGTIVILQDDLGSTDDEWFFANGLTFGGALRYLYRNRNIDGAVCYAPGITSRLGVHCQYSGSGLTFERTGVGRTTYDWNRLILLERRQASDPYALIPAEALAEVSKGAYSPLLRSRGLRPTRRADSLIPCRPRGTCR